MVGEYCPRIDDEYRFCGDKKSKNAGYPYSTVDKARKEVKDERDEYSGKCDCLTEGCVGEFLKDIFFYRIFLLVDFAYFRVE